MRQASARAPPVRHLRSMEADVRFSLKLPLQRTSRFGSDGPVSEMKEAANRDRLESSSAFSS
jgi:hypothetical protein